MVEVFKTNVQKESEARKLLDFLRGHLPDTEINFDLEDCDKILRVEGSDLRPEVISGLLTKKGFFCSILE